ncbi:hypothetical protein GPUN_2428 [Glaciecola punicea ACAM 611]|jgi:membrane protein YdbS with pleckstrin-like domain|uniref:Cardiolipin synthase N-terminal domain-containing protein n=1 Tax=Glaciecola punicea ACAM 611 TaxID=1121923 RepID=H5TE16_9ALTE|nr:hypothetical protein [Glaciecola punicea]OFA31086.1 hypothetical protein BAE46_08900 [Glaciecola punicea]GAB56543.1 hypothetical protein GPUN_2428 [Glaciecola punicea ACAM 611]
METIIGLLLFIPIAIIWLIPVIIILLSSRTAGGEKIAWLLAVIFVSWFAWIFYMLLAPLNDKSTRA